MCFSGLFSIVTEDFGNEGLSTSNSIELSTKASYYLYMTRILSNFQVLNLYTTTTTSQYFFSVFKQA